ncbi:M18 family aminopeptidase [Parablautia muri]|uniref:M18 family aminopeptidase n=1 Tax=Parablautia muri TaxID=2320879 RepID=A0A9X5BGL3_9FIRM|nr:M18 family aminopeptidase [Parablautia muri]NBJ93426.1 M18 family aminopeptidase [Parablautia muri]
MEKVNLEWAEKCLAFIDKSVSCYHAVEQVEKRLSENGFVQLDERSLWEVVPGGSYYVKRGDSSLAAFQIPDLSLKGFHITASHSDSPCFKIKTNPEMMLENKYLKLNVEGYGGMIQSTWFDRCLSVAGRVVCTGENGLQTVTVNVDEDLLVIPNLAIHMNRSINKGVELNIQTDLLPLMGGPGAKGKLKEKLAFLAGVEEDEILGSDLFLYVREKGKIAGAEKEWMISPRLDDLECVFASVEALLLAEPKEYCNMCVIFNHEEVGSHTKEGAASTFLRDTLERIGESLGKTRSDYLRFLADSFMISADNAHALHPNHPEKADPENRPLLNGGIVIKHHGGQRYTTDGVSEAVMKSLCREAQVPCQDYHNRSDIEGGSTLGNVLAGQVSVLSADIGLAQLAMHSAVETAGSGDVEYLIRVLKRFYEK